MIKTSKTVVFFGNERLVSGLATNETPFLLSLIESDYIVKAVVSHHTEERSRKKRPLEVAEIAKKHDIPVLLPKKPIDIIDDLRALQADIGVLVAYGRIVPQSVIDIFPCGIVNIHPSLLPKYRGSTPIESAILNQDSETGVSVMQLDAAMDAGDIYAQNSLPLNGDETKFDLYATLSKIGKDLLMNTLPRILDGTLKPTPQDNEKATYCQMFTKNDSLLQPEKLTAEEADAKIRAHLNFPKTKLTINSHTIVIIKAHIAQSAESALHLKCKNNSILAIDELIAPSGRTMKAADFLRGYSL